MVTNIVKTITKLGEIFGERFTPERIDAYVMLLKNIPEKEIEKKIIEIIKHGKQSRCPSPVEFFREFVPDRESPEDLAKIMANMVIYSVSKFGYYKIKEAENYLGPLIFKALGESRGWADLCQGMTVKDEGIYRAQLRGTIESYLRLNPELLNNIQRNRIKSFLLEEKETNAEQITAKTAIMPLL